MVHESKRTALGTSLLITVLLGGVLLGRAVHASSDHDMTSASHGQQAPYDLQFLDTMARHHEGAVKMAALAQKNGAHAELKELARAIADSQEQEIVRMQQWRKSWFGDDARAVNMDMAGMKGSMHGMDMSKLEAARGNEFDLLFIDMMIPHHEGAVEMGKQAARQARHEKLKQFANQVVSAQEAEIRTMKDWRAQWGATMR